MKPVGSLQRLEDYYVGRGLSGDELRQALEKDNEYQKLLAQRKKKIQAKTSISKEEAEKYVLSTDKDYEILGKVHRLENLNLSNEDKKLVKFIRLQLVLDWRAPIITELDDLLRKYKADD